MTSTCGVFVRAGSSWLASRGLCLPVSTRSHARCGGTHPAHRFVKGVREALVPALASEGLSVPIEDSAALSVEQGRSVVKAASAYVWANLSEGLYKDRPHIQSVFAFMTGT